jgi:hypothetical protein
MAPFDGLGGLLGLYNQTTNDVRQGLAGYGRQNALGIGAQDANAWQNVTVTNTSYDYPMKPRTNMDWLDESIAKYREPIAA